LAIQAIDSPELVQKLRIAVVKAHDLAELAVAEPPKTAGIRFKSTSRPKEPPNPEK